MNKRHIIWDIIDLIMIVGLWTMIIWEVFANQWVPAIFFLLCYQFRATRR